MKYKMSTFLSAFLFAMSPLFTSRSGAWVQKSKESITGKVTLVVSGRGSDMGVFRGSQVRRSRPGSSGISVSILSCNSCDSEVSSVYMGTTFTVTSPLVL